MITVNCPTCAAAYRLDAAKLGSQGRKLKCAKCATVWVAMAPVEPPPLSVELTQMPAVEPSFATAPEPEVVSVPLRFRPEGALGEVSFEDMAHLPTGARGWLRGENLWLVVGLFVFLAGILAAGGVYVNLMGNPLATWGQSMSPSRVIAPTAAAPVGVTLHHVEGYVDDVSGVAVLGVQGQLTNITAAAVSVPPLRLEIVGMDGAVRDAAPVLQDDPSATLPPQGTLPWVVSLTSPALTTAKGWRVVFR